MITKGYLKQFTKAVKCINSQSVLRIQLGLKTLSELDISVVTECVDKADLIACDWDDAYHSLKLVNKLIQNGFSLEGNIMSIVIESRSGLNYVYGCLLHHLNLK